MALYKRIEIDLTKARNNEVIDFGKVYNSFQIVYKDADFSFRVNDPFEDELFTSENIEGFTGEWAVHRLFITNGANPQQGAKAVILAF
ncbi:hypothetical protein [Tuberibacillus calidus]|jgi:6-pyruvoyl-tetrahydropterin synthase|uniref:hypothetical protein n=1 Tax=Tuberibacillus calidus TaxID=340097 RepID=UPI0003FD9EC1|nr:hypothetical protein [Tuberibacillus calidus]